VSSPAPIAAARSPRRGSTQRYAAAYTQSLNLLAESAGALLAPEAIVIAEHARRTSVALADAYGVLKRHRKLEQGDAALSFYRQAPANETADALP
jgi:ABC-type Fe2+-enterobactin transport system substrate-binding protein